MPETQGRRWEKTQFPPPPVLPCPCKVTHCHCARRNPGQTPSPQRYQEGRLGTQGCQLSWGDCCVLAQLGLADTAGDGLSFPPRLTSCSAHWSCLPWTPYQQQQNMSVCTSVCEPASCQGLSDERFRQRKHPGDSARQAAGKPEEPSPHVQGDTDSVNQPALFQSGLRLSHLQVGPLVTPFQGHPGSSPTRKPPSCSSTSSTSSSMHQPHT